MMGPGLLQKLCPFIPVEGDLLPVLDLLLHGAESFFRS